MPGITNPAEEYFKDGLWGWVTNAWKKLVATAGGALHIQFAGQEADVEVTQTAPADLTVGPHGWDGDSWQKLPMVWGYSDRWAITASSLTGAAGTRSLNFPDVDDGEVWVLLAIDAWNVNTNPSAVQFRVVCGAYTVRLKRVITPGADVPSTWNGHIVLKKDDYVQVRFEGCALDDDIWGNAVGYKMKIAE